LVCPGMEGRGRRLLFRIFHVVRAKASVPQDREPQISSDKKKQTQIPVNFIGNIICFVYY